MRTIEETSRFRRDYRREKKGQHGNRLDAWLTEVTNMLATDTALPRRYQDHRWAAIGRISATATFAPPLC